MSDLIPLPPPKEDEFVEPVFRRDRLPTTGEQFSRMSAVNNIENAFQIIGGVDRLALWANQEPGKFFTQLYAKLLPASSLNINGDNTKIEIVHALPPTKLDEHQ